MVVVTIVPACIVLRWHSGPLQGWYSICTVACAISVFMFSEMQDAVE